jgi:hypothetical protein
VQDDHRETLGLATADTAVTIKTGRPGTPVWRWLTTYFMGVVDQLAAFLPFSEGAANRVRKHWLAAGRQKTSILISPALERFPIVHSTAVVVLPWAGGTNGAVLDGFAHARARGL